MEFMENYQEALEKVLQYIHILDIEEKPLFDTIGQVLVEDVYSEFDLPLKDQAMPDGYAVRSADITYASDKNPVSLCIIETVRAGYLPKNRIKSGTAIRIMTGAVMPEGADCVVRFEFTDEPGNKSGPNYNNPTEVKVYRAVDSGTGISRKGMSVKKGMLVLSKGVTIGPAQISVLATIGKTMVKVIRRPVIAVISSGDELIELGQPLSPGKSYNCNEMAIASLVSHYGGIPKVLGIASDSEKSVSDKIKRGMRADAIITSGGVSKGDFDLVRSVLNKLGEVVFTRVEVGPGASVSFGYVIKEDEKRRGSTIPVFALAGPPAGCLINFEMLVSPSIFKMMGKNNIEHTMIEAVAKDAAPAKMPMTFARWSRLEKENGDYSVEISRVETSGALAAIGSANALTFIPKGTVINRGDRIPVLPLDWS
jgi:molybdopterin molybdotransferase